MINYSSFKYFYLTVLTFLAFYYIDLMPRKSLIVLIEKPQTPSKEKLY